MTVKPLLDDVVVRDSGDELDARLLDPAVWCDVSIGIIAWNEEDSIENTLESLFAQSIFECVTAAGVECEVVCVANGCSDRTPDIVREVFRRRSEAVGGGTGVRCRLVETEVRGKLNAWNMLVHDLFASSARVLVFMDADIVFLHPDTIRNVVMALHRNPIACVAVDEPVKHLRLHARSSVRDRLSLQATRLNRTAPAQITGQFYAIRAEAARRIRFPKANMGDDGTIQELVCTNFLQEPPLPERVVQVAEAAHLFEAYTRVSDILANQKRNVIFQVQKFVFLEYLRAQPAHVRGNPALHVRERDLVDPDWFSSLLAVHLSNVRWFWQLVPGFLWDPLARLNLAEGRQRAVLLPIALTRVLVLVIAGLRANRALRSGAAGFWPDTRSGAIGKVSRAGDESSLPRRQVP